MRQPDSARRPPLVGRAAGSRRHTLDAAASAPASTLLPESGPAPRSLAQSERSRVILLELGGCEPGSVFSIVSPKTMIGRSNQAEVTLEDATVSWEHARLSATKEAVHIEDLSSRNGTFINSQRLLERALLRDGDYLRFGGATILKFSMMDEIEENAHRTLFEVSLRDPLTRLYNRRYFDERLLAEFAFARRHGSELALLLLDIDHFKLYNDNFGHQFGDAVLKLVARSAQKMMRPEDVLARYGGDEMAILARATSFRNVEILGERLCRQIASLDLNPPQRDLKVTISVGVAYMGSKLKSSSADALLRSADLALFDAKAAGRNRAAVAPPGH